MSHHFGKGGWDAGGAVGANGVGDIIASGEVRPAAVEKKRAESVVVVVFASRKRLVRIVVFEIECSRMGFCCYNIVDGLQAYEASIVIEFAERFADEFKEAAVVAEIFLQRLYIM